MATTETEQKGTAGTDAAVTASGASDVEAPDAGRGGPDERGARGAGPGGGGSRLRTAVWVLLAVLLVAGGGALLQAHRLNSAAPTGNRALSDTAATQRVIGDVSSGLSRIFSYGPDTLDETRQAAAGLLTGKAAQQYKTLFAQVEQRVPGQHLTLTTHVVKAGVTRLTGTTAHLVVFLDQTSQRQGGQPASAGAQVSITAALNGARWQITEITSR